MSLRIALTGDLILDEPEPDSFFDGVRDLLRSADLVIGHVEVPHTRRARPGNFDIPAPPANPDHLSALQRAGVHVATLAGNHIFDSGAEGIEDTIATLRGLGIATTGAGLTLNEARTPAIVTRGGVRIGVLSFNCVGPVQSWASAVKAGCAYLRLVTADGETAHPAVVPDDQTVIDRETEAVMCEDIANLAQRADVVVVALHKGVGHTPALVARYERLIARAAVDAGADIVVGHHAHILRGVEVYKGRPIFHGLGNFVTVTRALTLEDNPSPARRAWAERRRILFGFEPDPAYPTYPFHPQAKNAILAICDIDPAGVRPESDPGQTRVRLGSDSGLTPVEKSGESGGKNCIGPGFFPCWIGPSGRVDPQLRGRGGDAVAAYVEEITRSAGLNAAFDWDGDLVRIRAGTD